jgi:hypothetical protein
VTRKQSVTLLITAASFLLFGLNCQTVTQIFTTPTPVPTSTPTPRPEPTSTPISLPTPIPTEYAVADEGVHHIEDGATATYAHYPPSSGLHYGRYLAWGFYEEEVPPEFWVHSLEHGGIVILYNCSTDCAEIEAELEQFMNTAPPDDVFNEVKLLISPNSLIEHKVIALAWGWELDLQTVDHELLLDFYQRHVNQGPELVP